jgi:amino-acid N-acetyltransferase
MAERASAEKDFYLRHFRHRTIVVHLADDDVLDDVRPVLDELVANRTLVVVSLSRSAAGCDPVAVRADPNPEGAGLVDLSAQLLATGIAYAGGPSGVGSARRLGFACRLAARLRAHKIAVVDPRGGLRREGRVCSFVEASTLSALGSSRAGARSWSRSELEQIRAAIVSGVESVNLTAADDLGAEMFTYQGAGTLVTAGDYARVEKLGVDDFPEALALLLRGERESFLLPRTPEERAAVLLCGYGVRLEGRRLAGIAGLRTEAYRRHRLSEVVGLYTITRFQGEGVGVRLIEALAQASANAGCRAMFAVTSNERAAGFFLRNGFDAVDPGRVPAVKWKGRAGGKPDRVFWREH